MNPAAGAPPPNWAGWPDGKKFAFVLTHDVESQTGLDRCRQTAELEMRHGFRSSFNFVPEGSYQIPAELRSWLVGQGFEVGIHDLHHDGKLFTSKAGFINKADRINRYVCDWEAAGFRAGFMLRRLDWYRHLDVLYDASTFDTDPFEFQSDGANTIFPFWFSNPDGTGYVELPYTLPQDSTLFLLLKEQSPEIWLRKLDWVARHGGMAMVIVHPDYLAFEPGDRSRRTYDVTLYSQLLEHVSRQYPGQYWQPLPRDLAAWYKAAHRLPAGRRRAPAPNGSHPPTTRPALAGLRGKHAAVLLYSTYPADPRPRRAAEALIDAGMDVDLLCLAESADEPAEEHINGVHVFRVPLQRRRDSKRAYFWLYGRFILKSFWFLTRRGIFGRYDLVHVHNMPDVLVVASLVPKLLGAKVVLDLHDPMPELMMSIYGARPDSIQLKLLKLAERWSIALADAVVTVNQACRRLFSSRSCADGKVHVVMNSPDEQIFRPGPSPEAPPPSPNAGRFVVMYHGSLVERHGLDLAVQALAKIRPAVPGAELRIYGKNTAFLEQVLATIEQTPLRAAVHYHGPKNLEQIVQAIQECDIGVIPNRRSIFTEINTPTRIFEYLSQGKPVIAPRASGILDYFGADDLLYFELGDADDLAARLLQAFREPELVAQTVSRGQRVYQKHCWSSERRGFEDLVARLLGSDADEQRAVAALGVKANDTSR